MLNFCFTFQVGMWMVDVLIMSDYLYSVYIIYVYAELGTGIIVLKVMSGYTE